jgi:hypothetical protein
MLRCWHATPPPFFAAGPSIRGAPFGAGCHCNCGLDLRAIWNWQGRIYIFACGADRAGAPRCDRFRGCRAHIRDTSSIRGPKMTRPEIVAADHLAANRTPLAVCGRSRRDRPVRSRRVVAPNFHDFARAGSREGPLRPPDQCLVADGSRMNSATAADGSKAATGSSRSQMQPSGPSLPNNSTRSANHTAKMMVRGQLDQPQHGPLRPLSVRAGPAGDADAGSSPART